MDNAFPKPGDTVILPNGRQLNMWADHPNHSGFEPYDHALAAQFHAQRAHAHASQGNVMGSAFHHAQAILHAHAAQGIPNKPLSHTDAPHTAKHDIDLNEHNKLISELKPFRLAAAYGPNKSKMIDFLKNKGKLSKSSFQNPSIDLTEVKRVEQERDPPSPTLQAVDSTHPGYGDMMKKMLRDRHAQRHGESSVGDQQGTQSAVDEDTRDRIRRAIANRGRRG